MGKSLSICPTNFDTSITRPPPLPKRELNDQQSATPLSPTDRGLSATPTSGQIAPPGRILLSAPSTFVAFSRAVIFCLFSCNFRTVETKPNPPSKTIRKNMHRNRNVGPGCVSASRGNHFASGYRDEHHAKPRTHGKYYIPHAITTWREASLIVVGEVFMGPATWRPHQRRLETPRAMW